MLHELGTERPYAASMPLTVEELELAPPQDGELLVRVAAAGLCHSDLSVVDGTRPGRCRWRWATRRQGSSRPSGRA